MTFRFLFFFCLLSFSSSLYSSTVESVGELVRLTNYEGHQGPIFALDDMSSSEGSCSRNDFFILPFGHKFFEENYSLLLAAKLAGKSVRVQFEMHDCVDSVPRLKHLSLM